MNYGLGLMGFNGRSARDRKEALGLGLVAVTGRKMREEFEASGNTVHRI